MARWEFEQWQANQAAQEMARNPFGLLVVGVIVTVFAAASPKTVHRQPMTATDYLDAANNCAGPTSCEISRRNVETAIRLDPKLARAYVVRGNLIWKQKQPGTKHLALRDYQKARNLYQQQHKISEVKTMDRLIAQAEQGEIPICLLRNSERNWSCL